MVFIHDRSDAVVNRSIPKRSVQSSDCAVRDHGSIEVCGAKQVSVVSGVKAHVVQSLDPANARSSAGRHHHHEICQAITAQPVHHVATVQSLTSPGASFSDENFVAGLETLDGKLPGIELPLSEFEFH